ncbi:MAG: adenylate/guanylate cyclase domain-containing response regulator [Spirochaetia bacterium]|nr:adenylate/guanylate cyclase domain-containing response regulator [Spirochaetia bacterium]
MSQLQNILIVEDEELQRNVLVQIMTHLGFVVREAENAGRAVEILKNWQPGLILLDNYLPDKSGLNLLKEIKEENPNAKIVLMSSDFSEEIVRQALYEGAVDVLNKPVQMKDLVFRLSVWLRDVLTKQNIEAMNEKAETEQSSVREQFSKTVAEYILSQKTSIEATEKTVFGSVLYVKFKNIEEVTIDGKNIHEVMNFMSSLYSEITSLIYISRGSVNKIVGTGILATFGLPVVYDNDTLNAVRCAALIKELVQKYNKQLPSFIKTTLKVGIGIGTGRLHAGKILSINRVDYSVFGRAVETAAVLSSLAAGCEEENILTDKETIIALNEKADYKEISIDGKMDIVPSKIYCIKYISQELSDQEKRQLQSIGEKEFGSSEKYELL